MEVGCAYSSLTNRTSLPAAALHLLSFSEMISLSAVPVTMSFFASTSASIDWTPSIFVRR